MSAPTCGERCTAAAHGIAFDDELYYVSALLHDIGLTEAFDSHTLAFEEAGGDLAWVFGVAAGWAADRAARATEIIVLHMRADVPAAVDPESHILQVATSWEVVGRRPEEFPQEARAEMLARYPRQEFGTEFLAYFEDQAGRKPVSAAAASVAKDAPAELQLTLSKVMSDDKRVEIDVREIAEIRNGLVSRTRLVLDMASVMRQLGMLPAPGGRGERAIAIRQWLQMKLSRRR